MIINETNLVIPHPRMHLRNFVLYPLSDIAKSKIHPILNDTTINLLNKLESINDQLNLTHYWIIFLKYKRIIILAPILFGVLGLFIALNINPTFQSQATLVIEESTKNIVNIEEVYGGDMSKGGFRNNNYINNQIQILESDEVLGNIILDKKIKALSLIHI